MRTQYNTRPQRQRSDRFLYFLVLAGALCLPASIRAAGWVPDSNRLFLAAFWGLSAGVLIAHSPLPYWLSMVLGVVLGAEYGTQFAGKLLPNLEMLLGDTGSALAWLWQLVMSGARPLTPPFTRCLSHLLSQGETMLNNLTTWLQLVQSGGVSEDNTALWLGVSFGVWMLAFHAGLGLFRRRRTFVALLPLGVGVISNVSATAIGMAYVHVYLGVTLVTLVWANAGRMERIWSRLRLDFSPELQRDAVVAGSVVSGLVFAVALLLPYKTYNKAVFFVWNRIGPTLEAFYDDLDRAFAGRNPVPEPTPSGRETGLPAHDIAGGVQPTGEVVFLVQTSDPAPLPPEELEAMRSMMPIGELVPKHYWRQRTYDVYTGHGWDSSERTYEQFQGNEAWTEPAFPHTVLTQTFRLVSASRDLAYAVNEPVGLDQNYRVIVRGKGDFAALSVDKDVYTVTSSIPDPTIEELQQVQQDYPDWVRDRYLQLPEIPARVQQMAKDVVSQADAVTAYDKARAIESYLREFGYDLELEPPPLDDDVVDYFLFSAKRGYCDYSATAMVVMLRAVGVPARYASGFSMGTYDYTHNAWVVTQNNGHAWVEVLFPGYGWVEFEPTPTQGVFAWPDSRFAGATGGSLGPHQERRSIPPLWIAAGVLALVVLFVIIWPPRWFRRARRRPRRAVWRVYDKLLRRGRWIGVSPYGGQTPREYLRALATAIERRARFAAGAGRDIALIEQAYQRARYGNQPITAEESLRVEGAWRRLRTKLARLIFVHMPRAPLAS